MNGAIGFFDSGVGGLGVLRHALNRVGGAPLLYAADSAYAPYGTCDPGLILQRCRLITRFLIEQGAVAIVVACNTATAVAVERLRNEFDVPIVGMEPALKPAAALTRSGHVAVLATPATLVSDRYSRLLSVHGRSIEVHPRSCRHWVEAVEQGDLDSPRVYDMVNAELAPLHRLDVDTFVLGCTHFPFLADTIRAVAGPAANLVDPGPAVVAQLRTRLGLTGAADIVSTVRLFSSSAPGMLQRRARALIGLHAHAADLAP